MESSKS